MATSRAHADASINGTTEKHFRRAITSSKIIALHSRSRIQESPGILRARLVHDTRLISITVIGYDGNHGTCKKIDGSLDASDIGNNGRRDDNSFDKSFNCFYSVTRRHSTARGVARLFSGGAFNGYFTILHCET